MLDGWDGGLTVPLREQLHQHIGRCATCSTRRDVELHPGRLFGQSPGEALAAAAAASLRVAAGPPDVLRAHTLALAAAKTRTRSRARPPCSAGLAPSTPTASPSQRPGRGGKGGASARGRRRPGPPERDGSP